MTATPSTNGKKRREVRRVIGKLDPKALYTREGCMRFFGIGSNSLIDARKSGIVKPVRLGKRQFYRGDQLKKWILTDGEEQG
jgi:hypothetical protein